MEKVLNKPFVSVFSAPEDKLWQRPDIRCKDELIIRDNEVSLSHVMFKMGGDAELRPLRPKLFFLANKKLYYSDPCQGEVFEGMLDLPFVVVEFIEPKIKKVDDDGFLEMMGPPVKKNTDALSVRDKLEEADGESPARNMTSNKKERYFIPQKDDLLLEVMNKKLHQTTRLRQQELETAQKPTQELYITRFYRGRKFTEISTYQAEVFGAFKDCLKKVCINTSLLSNFKITRKLCWDQCSRSCVGLDLATGEEIFIRTIEKDSFAKSTRSLPFLKSQIESMRLLDSSPWLSRLYYVFEDVSYVHLIMSYSSGPRLDESLKLKPQFKESDIRDFSCELILGIEYIHSRQIIHGNISPDTIILRGSGKPSANNLGKITSFKNLTTVAKGPPAFPPISKPGFIAPEILNSSEAELARLNYYKTDIFSLGAVIYYMMVGSPPFKGNTFVEILEANKTANLVKINPSSFNGYSEQWVSLILSMIDLAPERRPTAADCLRVLQVQSHLNLFATAESNRPKLAKKKLIVPNTQRPIISANKNIQISENLRESIFTSVFCTSKFTYDNQYPVLISSKIVANKADTNQPSNKLGAPSLMDKSIVSSHPGVYLSTPGGKLPAPKPNLAALSIGWNSQYGGVRLTEEPEKLSDEHHHSEPLPEPSGKPMINSAMGSPRKPNLFLRKMTLSENSTPQRVPSLPPGIAFGIKNLNKKVVMSERKTEELTRLFTVTEREIDKPRLRIRLPPEPKRMKDLQ